MNTARAAQKLGVSVVNGFTGSSIWHLLYSFPPVPDSMIEAGFAEFAERWHPILDVFAECGVRFALEVHPTEIAFDIFTAQRALDALGRREEFGFNFDPSHLHWQGVSSVEFIRSFNDRIYHVHVKDAIVTLNGRTGILGSHINFGDPRRGWDFRSPGRGGVDFEEIIRALKTRAVSLLAVTIAVCWSPGAEAAPPAAPARTLAELDAAFAASARDLARRATAAGAAQLATLIDQWDPPRPPGRQMAFAIPPRLAAAREAGHDRGRGGGVDLVRLRRGTAGPGSRSLRACGVRGRGARSPAHAGRARGSPRGAQAAASAAILRGTGAGPADAPRRPRT